MTTLRPVTASYMARLSHLRHPGRTRTEAARRALFGRFEAAVDPENRLRAVERDRRARRLHSAWLSHLAHHRTRRSSPGTMVDFITKYTPAAPDAPDTDEAAGVPNADGQEADRVGDRTSTTPR